MITVVKEGLCTWTELSNGVLSYRDYMELVVYLQHQYATETAMQDDKGG